MRLIFQTSSVTPDVFYVFNIILSVSNCSQSLKKICTWELLGANVLNIYTFESFCKNFFILCLTMERLFRRFFQYSVICYFSKYIRLVLTDFHENNVFYRKCMWLQLRQVLKKIHQRKREKIYSQVCFLCSRWRPKYRKTLLWARADYLSFLHQRARSSKTTGRLQYTFRGVSRIQAM